MSRLASGRESAKRQQAASPCWWQAFETDLGWLAAIWEGDALVRLTFGQPDPQMAAKRVAVSEQMVLRETMSMQMARKKLKSFASGAAVSLLDIKLSFRGRTEFQRQVLQACRRIPWGQVVSYGALAAKVGRPRAARAVGGVMRSNRHPLIVPCHRVIAANGRIGGYSAHDGVITKRKLLEREGIMVPG